MALDGILLNKIVSQLQPRLPMRIQKIWQISSTEVLFQVHDENGKEQLLVSCHSVYNRMLISQRSYPTPAQPGNFVMVLRKYLEGGVIEKIEQAGLDRWCTFSIRRHNDLGDLEYLKLYAELMGKYANLILVGPDGRIIDAMKRIPPFENQNRVIQPGAAFVPTPPQHKKDPFIDQSIESDLSLTKQFAGFSPFLSQETEWRLQHGENFHDVMEEIRRSDRLYIANRKGEAVFHCIELKSVGECVNFPLFEGFDILYYHREEKERIKQISGDIVHFCKRQLKHQETKLPRLEKEYEAAQDCDRWRLYGDLLYTYGVQDTKGKREMVLKNYEDNEDIRIPLDPKLDGPSNARRCYAKYGKLKKGQSYLQEQIDICTNEIHYFEGLLEQLDQADFATAEGIREELIKGGYLKDKEKKKAPKRKKETRPSVSSIISPSGIRISFGRNNLQNDYLTWHMARKNEIWLHAKDYHGAHVVIHNENPDEETLRLAANTAAYYSKGRYSSSVPVNWCPVRNLKKIPGAKPGMVQLGAYHTIYIDPDQETLKKAGIELED